ncbi:hypothetical protein ATANTOWER_032089 [Ataeniobius toweri]|uniref:Hyaluronidase n=1 Tax=Ataeniobius toweri TaxID=208326 RepID=A0ABU7AVD7_9TELE|nr:hypothetical protein [Ataeniobius toweri]
MSCCSTFTVSPHSSGGPFFKSSKWLERTMPAASHMARRRKANFSDVFMVGLNEKSRNRGVKTDLVSTIGESVAIGAAGVIFWGDTSYATSTSCSTLNSYLLGPLGHYLLNVTTAAEQCSQMLCKFRGRCLRRTPDSDVYLHLSPSTHRITSQSGKLKVTGAPSQAELKTFRMHFKCQCYSGYRGEGCEQRERGQNRAPSVFGTWPLCFLLPLGLLSVLH